MTPEPVEPPRARAPDPILAELWEVKREINRAADYRIEALVRMANEAAKHVRVQWVRDGRTTT
jgi:hypothetical protein